MSVEPILKLPVVLFVHQGQYFALEAAYVRSQGCVHALEPNNAVISFAAVLDSTVKQHAAPEHYLELTAPTGSWWIGLEQSADLVELPITDIHVLPSVLQARRKVLALQALAWYRGQVVSVLDARVLQVETARLEH